MVSSGSGERRVFRGTVRRLGLEGGLWALELDAGGYVELVDAPAGLRRDGARFQVEGVREGAEVTVGQVGEAVTVTSFTPI